MRRFDPRLPIEQASTPPYTWYTDPEIFSYEKNDIFEQGWMAVGRLDQVSKPGDYFTGEIVGNPYVVVRGEDGVLRAFHNVCRHKAAAVAESCGSCSELVCPYHGWSYRLDGSLQKAPHMGEMKNFDVKQYGLKQMAVETWGPFIFIDLDAFWGNQSGSNKRNLIQDLEPLKLPLEELGLTHMKFVERRVYEMNCNWKVFVDNSLDGGYHVAYTHEDLAAGLEFSGYKTDLFDRSSIQVCTTAGTDKRLGDKVIYAWMFPNFFINRYGRMMDTNLVLPISVNKCQVVFDFYFDYENLEEWQIKKQITKNIENSHRIQLEDVKVCESAQKGMESMAYDNGRYSSKLERSVHAFHCMLWGELTKRAV